MKKYQAISALMLFLSCQSQAFDQWVLSCSNPAGETLKITQTFYRLTAVTADLKTADIADSFHGTLNSDPNAFTTLTNPEGQAVQLKIRQSSSHGGRCGRCFTGDELTETYYAKLFTDEKEYNFVCAE